MIYVDTSNSRTTGRHGEVRAVESERAKAKDEVEVKASITRNEETA